MNLLYYLAEANLYLGVFYLAYSLLLTKETHYQLTRAYLLFSCIAAFVLPVLQIGVLKPVETAVNTTVNYVVPQYNDQSTGNDTVSIQPTVVEHHLSWQDYLLYIYVLGACVLFIMLMVKLYSLFKLMRDAQTIDQLKYKVVYLSESSVAFSFFNYLFIGNNAPGANTIIRHELVHIRQKHSFDIVFLELLKVINWFNPFVYLLQNSLKSVHEYIADEQTAALEADALTYSTFLVNNAYGTGGSSITHSFFNYNLLKKRIIMLNQQRSGSLARLKYLVTVPICAGLLCSSTLAFSKTYGWVDLDPAKLTNINPEPQRAGNPANSPVKGRLIIVDGKIYYPKPDETISADSMVDIPANNPSAIKKWGDKAKNGVRLFIGHAIIIKKANSPLTHTDQYGGRVSPGRLTNAMLPIAAMMKTDPDLLFIVNGKKFDLDIVQLKEKELIALTCDSLTVYEKGNTYAKSKWGNNVGQVTVLHGNASVKLVDAPGAPIVKFPPPIVTPNTDKFLTWDFITYLQNTIKFPNYPLDDSFVLTLKTSFVVANNKITDITMVKESDNKVAYTKKPKDVNLSDNELKSFQTEIIKALQNAPTDNIAPGNYSLPIAFLFSNDTKEVLVVCNRVMARSETGGIGILDIPVIKAVKKLPDDEKTPAQSDLESLGRYFANTIRYPAVDREKYVVGRVITLFAVDANHKLQYAKVVRTPSESLGTEVLRSLKACTEFSALKPGVQYVIPIAYTLSGDNGKYIGSQPAIGASPKLSNPDVLIYNPNSMDIPVNPSGSLMLNEIVIRGYIK